MDIRREIMDLRRQKPFVPFRIKRTNGESIVLSEPFMFGVNEIIMLIVEQPARMIQVPLGDIVSIDVLEPIP